MDRIKSLFRFYRYFIKGNKIIHTNHSIIEIQNPCIKKSVIRVSNNSKLIIGKNVILENVTFNICDGSVLIINDNCNISNAVINSIGSICTFGDGNIVQKGDMSGKVHILLRNSKLKIGSRNRLRCEKVWVRFGGIITIGNYNNFNEYSELRCDELINIGDFNQASYSVKIWDTNTHCIYTPNIRRKITIDNFPNFGVEHEKPKTNPVYIGSDNWFGMNVLILKGTVIGDRNNIGINTVISKGEIQCDKTVVNNSSIRILNNKQ